MKQTLLFILLYCSIAVLNAQEWSFGAHIGGGLANMKLNENVLNDVVTVQQGPVFVTGSFGIQGVLMESKDQQTKQITPKPALLVEASLCRCGGNIEAITTLASGRRSFSELNYVQYQGNFRLMGMIELRRLKLFFGPNFSYNFYSGVYVSGNETPQSASDQFKTYALGYEGGIGYGGKTMMLSARYRGYFTDYGLATDLFPTVYRNNQFRIVYSVYFLNKNREKNVGSIFWN